VGAHIDKFGTATCAPAPATWEPGFGPGAVWKRPCSTSPAWSPDQEQDTPTGSIRSGRLPDAPRPLLTYNTAMSWVTILLFAVVVLPVLLAGAHPAYPQWLGCGHSRGVNRLPDGKPLVLIHQIVG
jgi:hypothetical protein